MSHFTCPACSARTPIFGSPAHLLAACAEHDIQMLGSIPLHAAICEDADRGKPTVVSEPGSERAHVFLDVAAAVGGKVGL